jgi:hypothetical protein
MRKTQRWATRAAIALLALGLMGAGIAASFTSGGLATQFIDVSVSDIAAESVKVTISVAGNADLSKFYTRLNGNGWTPDMFGDSYPLADLDGDSYTIPFDGPLPIEFYADFGVMDELENADMGDWLQVTFTVEAAA